MKQRVSEFCVVLIMPGLLMFFMYFGFVTSQTKNTLSQENFRKEYYNWVYKYRFLSYEPILAIDNALKDFSFNKNRPDFTAQIKFVDPEGTVSFYLAFFLWNTFFAVLSAIVLYYLLRNQKWFDLTAESRLVMIMLFNFFIAAVQYIVVPYDCISAFFQLLGIACILSYFTDGKFLWLIALSGVVVVSTLNRESSVLMLSFLGALLIAKHQWKIKPIVIALLLPGIAFVATYVLLRVFLGFDTGVIAKSYLKANLTSIYNLAGMLFSVCTILLCFYFSKTKFNRQAMVANLVLTIPYFMVCLITGILFEIRLALPVFISLLILSVVAPLNSKPRVTT